MAKQTRFNPTKAGIFSVITALALATSACAGVEAEDLCPMEDQKKCTSLNLYLTAKDAAKMIDMAHEHEKPIFVDVRTIEEISFVGSPTKVDVYAPLKKIDTDYKVTPKGGLEMMDNHQLIPQVMKVLEERMVDKNHPIILICRSGDRAARAVDILAKNGFTKAYSVIDGFEGDMDQETGRRNLNGWKNADLPWTYKLDKNKMPAPDRTQSAAQ